jgi:hypothetical protein
LLCFIAFQYEELIKLVQSSAPSQLVDFQLLLLADAFMAELPKYDGDMTKQLEEAAAAGEVLRFVGGFHRD